MGIDYSDAPEQRSGELIPDGSFVKLILNIRAGGTQGAPSGDAAQDAADMGLFIASASTDAIGLDCEFIIIGGPYDKRKLFQWMTVSGGKLDDKGQSTGWNMTKQLHRAMIDSALGLDPADKSEATKIARRLPSFSALNGIGFYAKIGIEAGSEIIDRASGQKTGRYYDPKNTIERIVVPGDAEYVDLAAGKEVPPKPKHAAHLPAASSVPVASKPAWGNGAAAVRPAASAAAPPATSATPNHNAAASATQGKPAWLNR